MASRSAARSVAQAAAVPRTGSIISPGVDFLTVGGLSILVLVPMLLSGIDDILGVSFLITLFVPGPAKSVAAHLLGAGPNSVAPVLVSYFISIHHFFTDGVIWKLREPEVQQDLFAHARPVAATVPVPPMWWEKRFWQRRQGTATRVG